MAIIKDYYCTHADNTAFGWSSISVVQGLLAADKKMPVSLTHRVLQINYAPYPSSGKITTEKNICSGYMLECGSYIL